MIKELDSHNLGGILSTIHHWKNPTTPRLGFATRHDAGWKKNTSKKIRTQNGGEFDGDDLPFTSHGMGGKSA